MVLAASLDLLRGDGEQYRLALGAESLCRRLIGVGLAIGATQIVTGIQFLAEVLRRNRRP